MAKDPDLQLHRLARLYGIETAYIDVEGHNQQADPEVLLAALQGLGAPVKGITDVPLAVQARRQQQWQIHCEPVIAAWQGEPLSLKLRLPENHRHLTADFSLELETGKDRLWKADLSRLTVLRGALVEGIKYVELRMYLPSNLPCGYHRLTIHIKGRISNSLIILAPGLAYFPPREKGDRIWGLFLPLYALHSGQSWGAGDFSDLQAYLEWAMVLGNGTVGTLPLLASFLEEPFDPSPYAPASRLFWNEFYLDINQIPELARCPSALDLLNSPAFKKELLQLSSTSLVDYRRVMAAKRKVLEHLASCFFSGDGERQSSFRKWVGEHGQAVSYARFRATTEYRKAPWTEWPGPMREGMITEGDYLLENERYHLYAQWLADEQLRVVADQAREQGTGLYMDLPLGVHGAGYDVWHERNAFCLEASCGAPPDPFFSSGQNWGFPPLHPEHIRHQGYRYFIDYLRHQLKYAGILRLDHVMGLHHLYWIPKGLSACQGVYVKYRAEELYGILTLESQRYKTVLVGEDLGIVPPYVRKAMDRHNLQRMYVLPYQFSPAPDEVLNPIPDGSLATLNTHDMVPFAAHWSQEGSGRAELLLRFLYSNGWVEPPVDSLKSMVEALLKYLAASRARVLLINLEDLWLETAPQNIPGTVHEYPNWQRKARYALEEFTGMPDLNQLLKEVARWRKTIL